MTNAAVLSILSHIAMFIGMGFLLCGAIVMPHNEKHLGKLVLIGCALLVAWRSTYLDGAPSETLDVAVAVTLLLYRRPVWGWMAHTFGRERRKVARPHYPERRMHSQRFIK